MHTINYKNFLTLLSDPKEYFTAQYKEEWEYDFERLVILMFRNPQLFDDYYMMPIEAPKDVTGAKFAEVFSAFILEFLKNNKEIPGVIYDTFLENAKKDLGLDKTYEPSDEVKEYMSQLLIKDERLTISKEDKKRATAYASRLNKAVLRGVQDTDAVPPEGIKDGHIEKSTYDGKAVEIWLNSRGTLVMPVGENKTFPKQVQISEPIDYAIWNGEILQVKIIKVCDNILEFPRYFEASGMSKLFGFYNKILLPLFKKVNYTVLAIDSERHYQYPVKTITDISEDLKKVSKVLSMRSYLPYEYLQGEYAL